MTLLEIIKQDALITSYMLAIVFGLNLIIIVLGTITGTVKDGFDWRKFLFGILKALIAALCVVALVILCDIFAQLLNLLPYIKIEAEFITAAQVIAVVVAWCVDLFMDAFTKVKGLKELKYIKYDQIRVIDKNISTDEATEEGLA